MRNISFSNLKQVRDAKKAKYKASSNAEREFFRAIKKVAQNSGHIVEAYTRGAAITDLRKMTKALEDYSEALTPWAARQSMKLLEQVSKSNARAYNKQSKAMGKAIKSGLERSEMAKVSLALMNEQVALIKSLPIEAGLRAQKIAMENITSGSRAGVDPSTVKRLQEEMDMSTEVAINRAKLIARTETARANASFVQARAVGVGVEGYIWRTSGDAAVRHSHREMNGKFVQYSKPPLLSDGTRGHAGTFPNCRCWQDPVLPDID